jgi:oxygen-independent coproporphyrinogen-3 oxidase
MTHAGIYIHIPFCRSRCSYCDFATGMYEDGLAEAYVRALVREIAAWCEVEQPADVDTIYFGGGTPSLLTPKQISQILEAVHARFHLKPGAEVTMEMNPASIVSAPPPRSLRLGGEMISEDAHRRDPEVAEIAQRRGSSASHQTHDDRPELSTQKLQNFRQLGINRASFGAQTFDDRELKQLGRTHSSQDIHTTFRDQREAGFNNINFDLIAGLPEQTLKRWERNLDQALRMRPEHLSLYLLEVHEGTPLADQIRRGMRPEPDNDLAAEMYRLMINRVCAAGYQHYEISNFCLPGFESRHNSKYWTGAPYYGFGCSAHSYDGRLRRWSNERDTARYVALVERGQSPIVERTALSEDEARSESVFLSLRLMRGVNLQEYRSRFGEDLRDQFKAELDRLRGAGLIELDEQLLKLTPRGALLSNEVFATFV